LKTTIWAQKAESSTTVGLSSASPRKAADASTAVTAPHSGGMSSA
jgi:hypothetical protein